MVKETVVYAFKNGINLCFRPVNSCETHILNTFKSDLYIISTINEQNIGLIIYTYHMYVEERNFKDLEGGGQFEKWWCLKPFIDKDLRVS